MKNLITLLSLLSATTAYASTIHTADSTNNAHDSWNDPASWSDGIPSGAEGTVTLQGNATVQSGTGINADPTPTWSGDLTLNSNVTLKIFGESDNINALGDGLITLNSGSWLRFRETQTRTISNNINLAGAGAIIRAGESTAGAADLTFTGNFTGAFDIILEGNGGSSITFSGSNSFTSVEANLWSGAGWDHGTDIYANATGALGVGDVLIEDYYSLVINNTGAISNSATLTLTGAKGNETGKLVLNADQTISGLVVDGSTLAAGTYTSSETWLDGTGTLTVVPEPSVALLSGLGLLMLLRRRKC